MKLHTKAKSLALLAFTVLLTGCATGPTLTQTSTAASETSPVAAISSEMASEQSSEMVSSEEVSSAEEAASSEAPEKADPELLATYEALAKELADTPVGTAGSSLRMAQTSNKFVLQGKALKKDPAAFAEAMKSAFVEDPAMAKELLAQVRINVLGIVTGDEMIVGMVTDAGEEPNPSELKEAEWTKVFDAIEKAMN